MSEFKFDTLESVHKEIQDASPEVNAAAVAAHEAETVAQLQQNASNVDAFGTAFDAEVHATNKDGDPSVTSIGRFRKKKGASKVRTTSEAIQAQQTKDAARASGQMAADMLVTLAVQLGGKEWVPIGSKDFITAQGEFDEHGNLRRAFADWFEYKNYAMSPTGGLIAALSGYIMVRVTTGEETQSRLARAKIWISDKLNRMKRSKKDAAQPDSGDNGKRKDDIGEATGGTIPEVRTRSPRP